MSSTTAVEVLVADDSVERKEMMAVAGFLAGYYGSTQSQLRHRPSPAGATKPN